MLRGEIRWADAGGGFGRRPVVIVTADELVPVLSWITCAPITRRLRGLPTRLEVGPAEGLRERSEVVCESTVLVLKNEIDTAPVGSLAGQRLVDFDRALARALGIRRANLSRA